MTSLASLHDRLARCGRAAALAAALMAMSPVAAPAHPHIFAEARLDVAVNEAGEVEALRHLWRFDDLFSATVIMEFDTNGDQQLDHDELETVSGVIYGSLEEFNYFQLVTRDGADVTMQRPPELMASMENNQLIVFFEAKPQDPLPLRGKLVFGVYDPTFYTAIDFVEDEYLAVDNLPSSCTRTVVRPDADEIVMQNQDTLTDEFFTDPTDMSKIFATRLELACPAG